MSRSVACPACTAPISFPSDAADGTVVRLRCGRCANECVRRVPTAAAATTSISRSLSMGDAAGGGGVRAGADTTTSRALAPRSPSSAPPMPPALRATSTLAPIWALRRRRSEAGASPKGPDGPAAQALAVPRDAAPLEHLSAGAVLFGAATLERFGRGEGLGASAALLDRAAHDLEGDGEIARVRLERAALSAAQGKVVARELDAVNLTALHAPAARARLAALYGRLASQERAAGHMAAARRAALASLRAGGPHVPEEVAKGASAGGRLALLIAAGAIDEASQLALECWLAEKSNLVAMQAAASTLLQRALRLEASPAPLRGSAPSEPRHVGEVDRRGQHLEARRVAWERAIAVWAVVATWDVFWELFPVERAAVYKRELAPADVRSARAAVTTHIGRLLGEIERRHHDAGRAEEATNAERVREAFEAECVAARGLAVLAREDAGKHFPALPFPCGPLALDLLGVRADVVFALRALARRSRGDAAVQTALRALGGCGEGWELVHAGRHADAASFARARLRLSPADRDAHRLLVAVAKKRLARCVAEGDADHAEEVLLHWFPNGDVALEMDREVSAATQMLVSAKDPARALTLVRAIRKGGDAEPWCGIESRLLAQLAVEAADDPSRGPAAAIELLLEARRLTPDDPRTAAALAANADRLTHALLSAGTPDDAIAALDRLHAADHEPLRDFLAFALDARAARHAEGDRLAEAEGDLRRALRCATSAELRTKIADDLAQVRAELAASAQQAASAKQS